MSCSDESQDELNLCKFVYLSEHKNLLNNWGERNKYCINIMLIMGHLELEDVLLFKENKGRVWNFLKRGTHHIEIRTFGGTDYHTKINQVISELGIYTTLFNESTSKEDSEIYLSYLKTHANELKKIPQETIENYLYNSTFAHKN